MIPPISPVRARVELKPLRRRVRLDTENRGLTALQPWPCDGFWEKGAGPGGVVHSDKERSLLHLFSIGEGKDLHGKIRTMSVSFRLDGPVDARHPARRDHHVFPGDGDQTE